MKKSYIILVILALGAAAGFVFFQPSLQKEEPAGRAAAQDYKNATYIIEERPIALANGISELEATPGSNAKIITRYFGNEVRHDLDDDGREDVVFLLTQETGGSGTFFYAVAALNTPAGYVGSQAFFLGDRIAPKGIA